MMLHLDPRAKLLVMHRLDHPRRQCVGGRHTTIKPPMTGICSKRMRSVEERQLVVMLVS